MSSEDAKREDEGAGGSDSEEKKPPPDNPPHRTRVCYVSSVYVDYEDESECCFNGKVMQQGDFWRMVDDALLEAGILCDRAGDGLRENTEKAAVDMLASNYYDVVSIADDVWKPAIRSSPYWDKSKKLEPPSDPMDWQDHWAFLRHAADYSKNDCIRIVLLSGNAQAEGDKIDQSQVMLLHGAGVRCLNRLAEKHPGVVHAEWMTSCKSYRVKLEEDGPDSPWLAKMKYAEMLEDLSEEDLLSRAEWQRNALCNAMPAASAVPVICNDERAVPADPVYPVRPSTQVRLTRARYLAFCHKDIKKSPAHIAARHGKADLMAALIKEYSPVGGVESGILEKTTPLHVAIRQGNTATALEMLKPLDRFGNTSGELNFQETGSGGPDATPLHLAAMEGNVEVVTALIAAEADRTVRDAHGKLAQQVAATAELADLIARGKEAIPESEESKARDDTIEGSVANIAGRCGWDAEKQATMVEAFKAIGADSAKMLSRKVDSGMINVFLSDARVAKLKGAKEFTAVESWREEWLAAGGQEFG